MSESDAPEVYEDPFDEVVRLVRQRIEVDRAFGWDAPIAPVRRRAATPVSQPSEPAKARIPDRAAVPVVQTAMTEAELPRPAAPATDPGAALEAMRPEVAACRACSLCDGRTQTVFGVGNPSARVMFVGEAPGFEEDRRGEPFVGPAGQLLTAIIEKGMKWERSDVYIANVLKCRPPQNRTPTAEEMATCRPFLRRQIEIIQPEVIVALGSVASRGLLENELGVGRMRGHSHDDFGTPVRVTYHPAYLLRSPHEKRKTWEDIQAVLAKLAES